MSLRLTNVDGRFLFVPSQDPDLDVSLHQSLYGLRHFILELVLNRCGPQQLQVLQQKTHRHFIILKSVSGDQGL